MASVFQAPQPLIPPTATYLVSAATYNNAEEGDEYVPVDDMYNVVDPALNGYAEQQDQLAAGSGEQGDSDGKNNRQKRVKKKQDLTPEVHTARKESHKNVERKRRETINAGIDRLSDLLPPTTDKNKASILSAAATYIEELKAKVGPSSADETPGSSTNPLPAGQAQASLAKANADLEAQRDYWKTYVNTLWNQKQALINAATATGCIVTDVIGSGAPGNFQIIMPNGSMLSTGNEDVASRDVIFGYDLSNKRAAEDDLAHGNEKHLRMG